MDIKLGRLKPKSAQTKVRVKRGFELHFRFSLWLDCRGSMFARVAARRQRKSLKEELTHTRSVCVGVAETGVSFLFLTFGTFGHAKVRHFFAQRNFYFGHSKAQLFPHRGQINIFPRFYQKRTQNKKNGGKSRRFFILFLSQL